MDWADALDEMERVVEAADAVLRRGGPAPAAAGVPPGLGRMPPQYASRARRLLAATDDVRARALAARRQLAAVRRQPDPEANTPAYVDARA